MPTKPDWSQPEVLEDPMRWTFGAGIYFDGISFDGGLTWYLLMEGKLVEEELFAECMFGIHS